MTNLMISEAGPAQDELARVPPCSGHAYQHDEDDQAIGDWSDGTGEGEEDDEQQ